MPVALLIPLIPIISILLLIALQKTESAWVRPLLNGLAGMLRDVWFVGHAAADGVLAIERSISNTLGNAALAAQQPVAQWFVGLRTTINGTVYATSAALVASSQAIVQLVDTVLPRLASNTVTHTVTKVQTITKPLTVTRTVVVPKIQTRVKVLDKKSAAAVASLGALYKILHHAIAVDIPGTITGDIAGLRDYVNRKTDVLGKRIDKVKGRAAAVIGVGGLVALLVKAELGWLRCSRVKQLGKAACGIDKNLLESLLAGALLIASTISIVEFAKYCQDFTTTVEAPLKSFVRELRDVNPVKGPNASSQLAAYIAGNF